ncbi:hypothetical protein TM233_21730 [Bradyrhizobium sp. TM233]|nr:hypothetical protein TM233_21730 [Bradyrhizobium sp. TM233]
MQPAGARADEILARAPLEDGDIDLCKRELRGQHQAGRAAAGDHHSMAGRHLVPRVGSLWLTA